MKIADLPKEAKPREKALCFGVGELSDQELIALIIGSGVKGHSAIEIAKSLLDTFISLPQLSKASLNAIQKQKGLNKINSLKLIAAFELHRRLSLPKNAEHTKILSTSDIYLRFRYLDNLDHEVIVLLMLNRKREVVREITKYKGTFDSCSFDFKEIISELLDSNCSSYALVHNHPDASDEPSKNDVISTILLKEKTEEFGITLFDHVIIFKNGYYSFRENGHFKKNHFTDVKNYLQND